MEKKQQHKAAKPMDRTNGFNGEEVIHQCMQTVAFIGRVARNANSRFALAIKPYLQAHIQRQNHGNSLLWPCLPALSAASISEEIFARGLAEAG